MGCSLMQDEPFTNLGDPNERGYDAPRRNKGNHQKAAKELGINPSTRFRKVKSLKRAKAD
jgi:hypothetical protein